MTKYFLSFVEELIQDSKYINKNYVGGRIEVSKGGGYPQEEIRFFTTKTNEWLEFEKKYDFKYVSAKELEKLREIIKKKYCE